jgi:hypothetical protein
MEKIMKNFLIGLLITVTMPAWAGDRYHGHRNHHYHHRQQNYNWVAPLIIGGVVGAVIANETQRPVVQPPAVVYYSNPPVETMVINGEVYVKQFVLVNGQYREVLVRQ